MKLLLVGYGKMGQHHGAAAERIGLFSSITIVDPALSPRTAQELRSAGKATYTTLSQALQQNHYHAAIVAASVPAHQPLAQQLLQHRIPVLLEKPLGGTLAGWQQLLQLAQQQSTVLYPAFTEASHPIWSHPHTLTRALQQIGPLQTISAHRVGPHWWRPPQVDALSDLAIHDLHHLAQLYPHTRWQIGGTIDNTLSQLQFTAPQHPTVQLTAGWQNRDNGLRHWHFVGAHGSATADGATGVLTLQLHGNTSATHYTSATLLHQLHHFCTAIQQLRQNQHSPQLQQQQQSATRALELLQQLQQQQQANQTK